jgi:DNA-binding NarL/FixJ family response regulator
MLDRGSIGRRSGSGGESAVRILIAARQPDLFSAMKMFLEQGLAAEVVGGAGDGEELPGQIVTVRPDLVLLDWELIDWPEARKLLDLRAQNVPLKIIVLGTNPEQRNDALAAGANGFFCRTDPPKRLLTAIRIAQTEGENGW